MPDGKTSIFRNIYDTLKRKMGRPGKDEILEGNIIAVMFKLGWPIMVATFLRTLYNLVDTIWLGRLPGDEAAYSVAAASQAWSVVFIIMSVEIGMGIAALALISQYTGAKKFDKASEYAGQLYFIIIVLSIILGAVGYFTSPYLLDLLTGTGTEAAGLAEYGTAYLQIIFMGIPAMFLFFAFMFILRGWGDNITPMKIVAVTATLNMIVDPILIFGSGAAVSLGPLSFTVPTFFGYSIPKLGIRGAAYATIGTRAMGTIYSIYLMFSGKLGIKLKLSYLIPDITKIMQFIKVGLPASAGRFFSAMGFLILWAVVYRLPNPKVAGAAYGAGSRILNITFLVTGGVSMAMATMVGQGLGADLVERTEKVAKTGLAALAVLMSIIAITIFFTRNILLGFIVPNQPEVISSGAEFLLLFSLSMPFFGIFRGITDIFGGSGHTVQKMILDLTRIWAFRLIFVFLLGIYLGMADTGVWIGMGISNVVAAALAFTFYSMGWWKEKVIHQEPVSKTTVSRDKEVQSDQLKK
ncbi:MAG: MATE family efflux transporter [Candidatus Saliniplasma sp.]